MRERKYNKIIVISAVNLINGGTLSILKDFLNVISLYLKNQDYKIVALINSKKLLPVYDNVEYIEYPKAKKSYLIRIYYEYFAFRKLSRELIPEYWISLHDMTPNVIAKHRMVYMHNPSPFYKVTLNDFKNHLWSNILFALFYKWVYRINVHKNDYVIVQQACMRNQIAKLCNLSEDHVIVAYPELEKDPLCGNNCNKGENVFVYPSFARPFKNQEVVCKAAKILSEKNKEFSVVLTIDGTENEYSRKLVNKYRSISQISFMGVISREKVFDLYAKSKAMIFPSKLETWGLPISEYKVYEKPMILADLPYAYETSKDAKLTAFFNPEDAEQLARLMGDVVVNDYSSFSENRCSPVMPPFFKDWISLFDFIFEDIMCFQK